MVRKWVMKTNCQDNCYTANLTVFSPVKIVVYHGFAKKMLCKIEVYHVFDNKIPVFCKYREFVATSRYLDCIFR